MGQAVRFSRERRSQNQAGRPTFGDAGPYRTSFALLPPTHARQAHEYGPSRFEPIYPAQAPAKNPLSPVYAGQMFKPLKDKPSQAPAVSDRTTGAAAAIKGRLASRASGNDRLFFPFEAILEDVRKREKSPSHCVFGKRARARRQGQHARNRMFNGFVKLCQANFFAAHAEAKIHYIFLLFSLVFAGKR